MKESRPIYHTTAIAWITAMVLLLICSILSQVDPGRPYRFIRNDRTEARAGHSGMASESIASISRFTQR